MRTQGRRTLSTMTESPGGAGANAPKYMAFLRCLLRIFGYHGLMIEKENMDGASMAKETLAGREERILDFWTKHEVFKATLEATKNNEPFVFFDGPPFATGMPHYGHLLAGTIKDVIPRFQTMRGRFVRRVWGWDCHGLPIENMIEKELGLKNKKDIEDYGVGAFNAKAEASVFMYDHEWKKIIPRMGRWVDMEDPYKTMDAGFMASVWWAFKKLWDKKLIYEGYKSMHICPRCSTTLASNEVALGYKDVKDISVFVKFPLKDDSKTALVAWTTTPWTLPGNVALAIDQGATYVKFTIPDDAMTYIAMKERVAHFAKNATIVSEMPGTELVGLSVIPPFVDFYNDTGLENHANGWKVYHADFVTADGGTGIVHIAPAFGEDDMSLGNSEKLPFVQHVGMDGVIKGVEGFSGMMVKPKSDDDRERLGTDIAVLKKLQDEGTFFSKENIVHSYPHCWRCEWPLLNYAAGSWFVNVTVLKDKMAEANRSIDWVPDAVGHSRFQNLIEQRVGDWAISRSRYWGSAIPVWKCSDCDEVRVIGGIKELREAVATKKKNNYFLLRHGEAESNVPRLYSSDPKANNPLTEAGRDQVIRAAVKLSKLPLEKRINMIIASPFMRTRETAAIIARQLGLDESQVSFDDRLGEYNVGIYDGRPISDLEQDIPTQEERFVRAPEGGETYADMKRRVGDALYDIDSKHSEKNVLLVTHGDVVWMLDGVANGWNSKEMCENKFKDGEFNNAQVKELEFAPLPHNADYSLDLHRPHIDDVTLTCECGHEMKRIPEVFDCWFESGSMPFAQHHFDGDEGTEAGIQFVRNFPADFIAEGLDQTRGWFNSLLVLGIGLFGKAPYKNVIVNGLVLAEDGQKMSKSKKNYPDPMEVVGKYGADAVRFYMINSPAVRGEDLRFSALGVDEVAKKLTLRLDNVRAFYELYTTGMQIPRMQPKVAHVLDKWMISRWNETHAEVTNHLMNLELDRASKLILPLIDDLSTWWLRRSRERLKGEGLDRAEAEVTLGWTLFQLSRLLAPFTPFLAEDLYQKIGVEGKKLSVHLEDWPLPGIAFHDALDEMQSVRDAVTKALEQRAKEGVKVRQPLQALRVGNAKLTAKMLADIIADEVNVKEVIHDEDLLPDAVLLELALTPLLIAEGAARDLLRAVQEARKSAKLSPGEPATLVVVGDIDATTFAYGIHELLQKEASIISIVEEEAQAVLSLPMGTLRYAVRKS